MRSRAHIVNRKWKIAVVLFAIHILLFTPFAVVEAAFLETPATARLAALGGSYVAIADDAATLTANPAGLGTVRRPEVAADYSRIYTGLSDSLQISHYYLGAALPLRAGGTLAAGFKEFDFGSLYSERVLSIGYGRWWTSRLALGANVKQLHHSYSVPTQTVDDFGNVQNGTPDFFTQNGSAKSAYSADLGALYKCGTKTTLGLAVQDINEPNVALSPDDNDPVARTVRAGLAYQMNPGLTLASAVDTREALPHQRDWIWTGGTEWKGLQTAAGGFPLRGSITVGSREYRQGAVGAGYIVGELQLDYAFMMGISGLTFGDSTGTHRFSMTYRFGDTNKNNLASSSIPGPSHAKTPAIRTIEIEFLLEDPART